MSKKEDQIDSSAKKENKDAKKDEPKDAKKKDALKDEKGQPLSEDDIKLIMRYGKGPYNDPLKTVEEDIKKYNQTIQTLCGIKESDTGLALPAQWNLQQDAMMMK